MKPWHLRVISFIFVPLFTLSLVVSLLSQLVTDTEAAFVSEEKQQMTISTASLFPGEVEEKVAELKETYEHTHSLFLTLLEEDKDLKELKESRTELKESMEEFEALHKKVVNLLIAHKKDDLPFVTEGLEEIEEVLARYKKMDIELTDEKIEEKAKVEAKEKRKEQQEKQEEKKEEESEEKNTEQEDKDQEEKEVDDPKEKEQSSAKKEEEKETEEKNAEQEDKAQVEKDEDASKEKEQSSGKKEETKLSQRRT